MKSVLLFIAFSLASVILVSAQSRVSIAPTYWFNYNPYSYQVDMAYSGSQTHFQASGHTVTSSFGLTVRYHFTPQWNVSVGALYNSSTNHIKSPQTPYSESTPFTTGGVRLPIMVSYRLTSHRVSPYLSAGATFTNNKTFTDAPVNSEGVIGVGLD
ncbi:outer membrane beta-barrel protein, partial [Micromonospora sp. 4G57]|uniref:outer membrane beta-barrel protein n=1 Tax=Micromonospora sicca TaxID=2202420 RepID=UPI002ACA69E0